MTLFHEGKVATRHGQYDKVGLFIKIKKLSFFFKRLHGGMVVGHGGLMSMGIDACGGYT